MMKNPSLSVAFSRRFLSHPPPALVSSACCSTTWSASLSDGLRKFLTLMPSSIRPTIVYGGKSYPSTKGNVSATNFLDFV